MRVKYFLMIFILCGYITGRNYSEKRKIGLSCMGKGSKGRNTKTSFIVYLRELFRQKYRLDFFIF